jgi:hypothetical protein
MTTLYELLGALPHDDAEDLRAAFRKAAKATHPDTNPDDPDASSRFRELVHAHDILSDADQRAAYDQLLTLALQEEPGTKSKRTVVYETIQKLASSTIAATIISGVLVTGYTLFVPMSDAPALWEKVVEVAAPQTIEIAAPATTVRSDAATPIDPREARETHGDTRTLDEITTTGSLWPADGAEPIANVDTIPNLPINDAKFYRRRGVFAYRDGDLYRALADFDLAIQHDPNDADAYVDRGIVLYRMRQFDRAFADMTKAKEIGTTRTTKITTPAPPPQHKISLGRLHNATLNIASSDRFVDAPIQSVPSERRR